jgi:hypothetical protein
MSILLSVALAASPVPVVPDHWLRCARETVIADLASDAPRRWSELAAVPGGVDVQVATLPSHLSAEAFDAVHRVLFAVPARNEAYVVSTGGFAGFRHVHGPVALAGRCALAVAR